METTKEFDEKDILKHTLFSTFIKSTNEDIIEHLNGIRTPGVIVNGLVVDLSSCIIIDKSYVKLMDLVPILDANGKHCLASLEDGKGKIKYKKLKMYDLDFFDGEDEEPLKRECIAMENIKQNYGVDILYGKNYFSEQ